MLKSMTGFGRAEKLIETFDIKAQIKSVNHRYSDFNIRMPKCYSFLEDKIRMRASEYISRGKIEININIDQKESDDREITLNMPVAESYLKALRQLSELGIQDDVRVSTLSKYSDIFNIEYKEVDEDEIWKMIDSVLTEALEEFVKMRQEEGLRLEADIDFHLTEIEKYLEKVEELAPQSVENRRQRLLTKIQEYLDDAQIDHSRIVQETAIFADKVAIDEETTRLHSHINEFRKAIKSDKPIGKKLDFVIQEMNREPNTIGSKCNELEITRNVVEIKSEIEKIREQIQNIE